MLYFTWQKEAAKQVWIIFKYLKEDEMAIFLSNKSYFKYKIKGLKLFVNNNKEYIEILSNNKDKS
jgi:hypothetical protein